MQKLHYIGWLCVLLGCQNQSTSQNQGSVSSSDLLSSSSLSAQSMAQSSSSVGQLQFAGAPWVVASYAVWKENVLPLDQVPWEYLTHIRFAFAVPSADGSLDLDRDLLGRMAQMAHGRGKEALLVLGGGGGSGALGDLTQDPAALALLVKQTLELVDLYQLDGVVVDWELWPTGHAVDPDLEEGLVKLMQALYVPLNQRRVHLGMDVYASDWYGVHTRADNFAYCDYLNIMTLDDAGSWSSKPSHHSSLALMKSAVSYWKRRMGAKALPLTITLPHYGYEFDRGFSTGQGNKVRFKSYRDLLGQFPDAAVSDSLSNDSVLVFHQSMTSLAAKTAWVKEQKLLGVVNWEQSFDSPDSTLSLLRHTWRTLVR